MVREREDKNRVKRGNGIKIEGRGTEEQRREEEKKI